MQKLTGLATLLLTTSFLMVPIAQGAKKAHPVVRITTSLGDMEIELYPDKAAATVENFLNYVNTGFFNDTIFHRVIKGFMIQGGGFTPEMDQKQTGAPVKNEADNGLQNLIGTIAMARTNDPHSATAQFFINTADNAFLNHSGKNPGGWGYAVFGKVIKGMDTVKKIESVATGAKGSFSDVPTEDVVIIKVEMAQ